MAQTATAIMPTSPADLLVGGIFGFIFGVVFGFIVAKRSKHPDTTVTAVQVMSVAVFFGFIFVSFYFQRDIDPFIAIAILATGYGAKGGEFAERILDRAGKRG